MGKIRKRQKFHAPAPKLPVAKSHEATRNNSSSLSDSAVDEVQFKLPSNIFKGFKIDLKSLNVKLSEDDDAASIISSKSTGSQLQKKAKRALKHEAFLMKLHATKAAERKLIEQQKRKETPVVGDMQPLADALPTLDLLLKNSDKSKSTQTKPRGSRSFKQQQKAMLKDIETYRQVLSAPEYCSNPFEAIQTHLKSLAQSQLL